MKVCSEEIHSHKFSRCFFLVPSNIDKLKIRLEEDKNTLNIIWKRINNNRLPPIPKSVLTVSKIK